jgi:Na+/H+-dicarboxylate symporter
MLAASLIGLVSALVGGPGRALGSGARSALGAVLGTQHDTLVMPLYAPPITEATPSPVEAFFHSIVPANVFTALASDAALQIIFVAIVFGAAVGTIGAARRAVVIDFLEGVFEAFQMILNRLMLFLPLGLIAITAANFGEFNGTTAGDGPISRDGGRRIADRGAAFDHRRVAHRGRPVHVRVSRAATSADRRARDAE